MKEQIAIYHIPSHSILGIKVGKDARTQAASKIAFECALRNCKFDDFALLCPVGMAVLRTTREMAKVFLSDLQKEAQLRADKLTVRQKEVLYMVLDDLQDKEIASRLNISLRTAKFHVSALLKKYGVQNRRQLRKCIWGSGLRLVGQVA